MPSLGPPVPGAVTVYKECRKTRRYGRLQGHCATVVDLAAIDAVRVRAFGEIGEILVVRLRLHDAQRSGEVIVLDRPIGDHVEIEHILIRGHTGIDGLWSLVLPVAEWKGVVLEREVRNEVQLSRH